MLGIRLSASESTLQNETGDAGAPDDAGFTQIATGPPAPISLDGREATVICVVTRFRLKSPVGLLATYLDYLRVARQARRSPGLLREAFLIQNLVTCYSLSLWSGPRAIAQFGSDVPAHVDAARRVSRRARWAGPGRKEIWSTRWQLLTVSHNLNWDGFDLWDLVLSSAGGGGQHE